MSESEPEKLVDKPLQFNPLQLNVIAELRKIETGEYPLSNWYVGALYALANTHNPDRYSQAAQSLRELVEKLPRIKKSVDTQAARPDFKGMRADIYKRISKDLERYDNIWLDKVVDSKLDQTLIKINEYVSANQGPSRSEQADLAIQGFDPMSDALGENIRKSKRKLLQDIWSKLEAFAHHNIVNREVEFIEYFSNLETLILDLLAPVTAENQKEILSLLDKHLTPDVFSEIDRLIKKRGSNFIFFFTKANNPSLLPFLESAGYFASPANIVKLDNGNIRFPIWYPILYLQKIVNAESKMIVDILKKIPKIDNYQVLMDICEIVLDIESVEQSLELKKFAFQLITSNYRWINSETFTKIIIKWSNEDSIGLAKLLVESSPDPDSYEKQKRWKTAHDDYTTTLNPSFKLDDWHYQKILDDALRPLSLKMPFKVASMLIDCVSKMIEYKFHHDEHDGCSINDYSEIWCTRLDSPSEYPQREELLMLSLTSACEQVFENDSDSITTINDMLLAQPWHIFKRLRQHLYAKYPSDITLPWIRALILAHKDYENSDIHFEFQQMIRNACKAFGKEILSEDECRIIFDAIMSGPSRTELQERLGDKFKEENYITRKNFFQMKQLKPFEKVLFGEYLARLQQLVADVSIKMSEDDYLPYKSARGGFISKKSPKPADDLAALDDTLLLAYINEWQSEHFDPDNWLVEIDISALADAFKKVFITSILESPKRFTFWMENKSNIQRPIYVRAIVNAFAEQFQASNFKMIESALAFCKWVLTRQDSSVEDVNASNEESNTNSDWGTSRRAVCDLIDICLAKDSQTPISVKNDIEGILELLCIQYDRRLDRDEPVFLNQRDYLSEAINNTRSRSLEDLINYGYWLRRHDKDASVDVVFDILEKRLAGGVEFKLTIPEHALLGLNFGRLAGLDEDRAKANKNYIFPKEKPEAWSAAFSNLLRYSQPYKLLFNLLEDDYRHALDFIKTVEPSEKNDRDWTDTLGQHLFSYALWQVFPFQGEESLLEQYYINTKDQPERWARLFDHIGRSLKNSGSHINDDLKLRVYEFVKWRLEQKSEVELKDFSFWLGAECLDAKWRLETFSKVLDITQSKDFAIYNQIEELNEMLDDHMAKVVECFAKLMRGMSNLDFIYIQADKAKPILTAGLNHSDALVKGFAEQARESLLRAGHFEFLD